MDEHATPLPIMKFTEKTRAVRARWAVLCCALPGLVLVSIPAPASAATFRSANFVASATSEHFAEIVAQQAEEHRRLCAIEFLGHELPRWEEPCRISVTEQTSGGNGWTSYEIFRGKVENLRILVRGRRDHILDYLIPHEVAHAVLAVSLGRPVPRWADEGLAMLCETETQLSRQRILAAQMASTDAIVPLSELLHRGEYPEDHHDVMDFYASSFSFAEFLAERGGTVRLVKLLQNVNRKSWEESICKQYGFENVNALEADWKAWAIQRGASQLARLNSSPASKLESPEIAMPAEPITSSAVAVAGSNPSVLSTSISGAGAAE